MGGGIVSRPRRPVKEGLRAFYAHFGAVAPNGASGRGVSASIGVIQSSPRPKWGRGPLRLSLRTPTTPRLLAALRDQRLYLVVVRVRVNRVLPASGVPEPHGDRDGLALGADLPAGKVGHENGLAGHAVTSIRGASRTAIPYTIRRRVIGHSLGGIVPVALDLRLFVLLFFRVIQEAARKAPATDEAVRGHGPIDGGTRPMAVPDDTPADDLLLGRVVTELVGVMGALVERVESIHRDVLELRLGFPLDAEDEGEHTPDESSEAEDGPSVAWQVFAIGHDLQEETSAAIIDPEVVLAVALHEAQDMAEWSFRYTENVSHEIHARSVAERLIGHGYPTRSFVTRVVAILKRLAAEGHLRRLKPRRRGEPIAWWPSAVPVSDHVLAIYTLA
ncbi:MAG: hypothetical protein KGL39_48315 [Patescibacteria group bacterium]|nr:hypothetical protein [Patescibacteria group bacterium]